MPTTSIFLAKLVGPLFVAMGLGLLVNQSVYTQMAEQFLGSYALIYLSGLLALVAGLAMINVHNVWTREWRVIITVFGWLAVIGGLFRIVLPQFVASIGAAIFAQRGVPIVAAIAMLALGAFLSFKGYWQAISFPIRE